MESTILNSFGEKLYIFSWKTLNWFYPAACVGCGKEGVCFCETCLGQAPKIIDSVCERCGNPLPRGKSCPECARTRPVYLGLRCYGHYQAIFKEAVHQLKYHKNTALGLPMSQLMCGLIDNTDWSVDAVIPIPLSEAKLRQRGYNQAYYLAKPIALHIQKPCLPKGMIRLREAVTQTHLNAVLREENVRGAFLADPKIVAGRNVLLVDDVFTTGATMRSASQALREAGAKNVYAVVFAKTEKGALNAPDWLTGV